MPATVVYCFNGHRMVRVEIAEGVAIQPDFKRLECDGHSRYGVYGKTEQEAAMALLPAARNALCQAKIAEQEAEAGLAECRRVLGIKAGYVLRKGTDSPTTRQLMAQHLRGIADALEAGAEREHGGLIAHGPLHLSGEILLKPWRS